MKAVKLYENFHVDCQDSVASSSATKHSERGEYLVHTVSVCLIF